MNDIHDKTGISKGNLSDIENNKVIPSGKTLLVLMNEFNISSDWILMKNKHNTLEDDEQEVLKIYKSLDKINKKIAISELKHIHEIQEIKKQG